MRAQTTVAIAGGVLLVGVLIYVWQKGLLGIAKSAAQGAADLAGGAVVGLGTAIGIPETNMTECDRALAEGRYWDASFACPAGRLLKGVFGDTPAPIASAPTAAVPASTGTASPGFMSPAPDFSMGGL